MNCQAASTHIFSVDIHPKLQPGKWERDHLPLTLTTTWSCLLLLMASKFAPPWLPVRLGHSCKVQGTHGLPNPWRVCWCVWLSHYQQGPTTTFTVVCSFFNSSLATDFKINSKWIKDLNVRPETVKLLEENIGKILPDVNHSGILYDPPPRAMGIKAKINKWDLSKLKSFCTTNETISKVKRQPSEWEEMLANEATDKELISKIYKQLI